MACASKAIRRADRCAISARPCSFRRRRRAGIARRRCWVVMRRLGCEKQRGGADIPLACSSNLFISFRMLSEQRVEQSLAIAEGRRPSDLYQQRRRACRSEAEPAKISPVLLQISCRVGTGDFMRPEVGVKLDARFKTEETAQLRLRQPTALVFFGGERFKRPARQVTSVSHEALGNIIGNFDNHIHRLDVTRYRPWNKLHHSGIALAQTVEVILRRLTPSPPAPATPSPARGTHRRAPRNCGTGRTTRRRARAAPPAP